jgi:hypothetical protein
VGYSKGMNANGEHQRCGNYCSFLDKRISYYLFRYKIFNESSHIVRLILMRIIFLTIQFCLHDKCAFRMEGTRRNDTRQNGSEEKRRKGLLIVEHVHIGLICYLCYKWTCFMQRHVFFYYCRE